MKCVYIADDGTQFADEDDCREYEFKESIKGCNLVMLDHDLESINDIERFEYCDYVYIRTKEDCYKLENFCDYMGLEYPEGIGSHFYDKDYDKWFSIDDRVVSLEEEAKRLKDIKERLEK